jgi:hypothetical protein
MKEIKERMVQQAVAQYRSIFIPPHKTSFSECFSFENNTLIFWFNTEDHSTHLLAERPANTVDSDS